MAALIPLVAWLSIGGWPTTFPHLRLALALDRALPAEVGRSAVEEAAALWTPYGVAIVQLDPSADSHGAADRRTDGTLSIRVAEPSPDAARAWSSPFASIRFLPDGEPEPTILLHYDAMLRLGLGTISLGGAREPHWPRAVRNAVLARMIGRVVAHEIGHWLLKSRDHSPAGLMRARQTTDELADPARGGFGLMPANLARLRALLVH